MHHKKPYCGITCGTQTHMGVCHTGPFLLSPSLRVKLMSTSTTPMSSSRLFGSSKAKDSSLTLKKEKEKQISASIVKFKQVEVRDLSFDICFLRV